MSVRGSSVSVGMGVGLVGSSWQQVLSTLPSPVPAPPHLASFGECLEVWEKLEWRVGVLTRWAGSGGRCSLLLHTLQAVWLAGPPVRPSGQHVLTCLGQGMRNLRCEPRKQAAWVHGLGWQSWAPRLVHYTWATTCHRTADLAAAHACNPPGLPRYWPECA